MATIRGALSSLVYDSGGGGLVVEETEAVV
uniref:Uncharacterized protein n=1 Tax=Arundo donax TaxID=35708 RepID=A0A0A8YS90_ARUDO